MAGVQALWGLAVGVSALVAAPVEAQDWMPVDARSRALGGAGVAFAEGPSSSYWNPAALAAGAQRPLDFDTGWGFDGFLFVGSALEGDVGSSIQTSIELYDQLDLVGIQARFDAGTSTPQDAQDAILFTDSLLDLAESGQGVLVQTGAGFHVRIGPIGIFSRLTGTAAGDPLTDFTGTSLTSGTLAALFTDMGVPGALSPEAQALAASIAGRAPALAGDSDGDGAPDAAELAFQAQQALGSAALTNPALIDALGDIAEATAAGGTAGFTENQSGVDIRSMVQEEIGISFGLPVVPSVFELGISLKFILTETYYERVTVAEAEEDDLIEEIRANFKENRKRSTDFSMDLGARVIPTPWLVLGLVGRNLIPYSVDMAGPGGDIRIRPEVRGAVQLRPVSWFRVGTDLDLVENDSDLLEGFSWRHFGAGAEFDLSVILLRVGYRENLASSFNAKGAVTGGLGVRIGAFFFDLAGELGLGTVKVDSEALGETSSEYPERAAFGLTFGVDTSF